jgi:hypothetical protein
MVVGWFSIVSICSKRLFIIFFKSWFADEIGLCVALALYLWERNNLFGYLSICYCWLFELCRSVYFQTEGCV